MDITTHLLKIRMADGLSSMIRKLPSLMLSHCSKRRLEREMGIMLRLKMHIYYFINGWLMIIVVKRNNNNNKKLIKEAPLLIMI